MSDVATDLIKQARDAFLAFAEALLARMIEWAKLSGIPEVRDIRFRFSEKGAGHEIVTEPSYWRLLSHHDPGFTIARGLAEAAVTAHLKAGLLKPPEMSDAAGNRIVSPTFDQISPWLARTLLFSVMRSLEQNGTLVFDRNKVECLYELYLSEWTATSRKNRAMVPLLNFTTSTELRFGPSLELAVLNYDEKTRLYNLFGPFNPFLNEYILFSQSHYQLVGSYFDDEKHGVGFGQILGDIFDVLSAFRLLKAGKVGADQIIYRPESPVSDSHGSGGLNDFQIEHADEQYSLEEVDTAPVLSLYELLKKGRSTFSVPLDVALRRFNQSYGRRSPKDKILDLTIALESSLLAGLKDELAFRLGMRGAALLAETEDAVLTNAVLQSIYEIRSQIVHEGRGLFELEDRLRRVKRIDKTVEIGKIPEICEELVRKVIKAYLALLSSGKKITDINAELDAKPLMQLKTKQS